MSWAPHSFRCLSSFIESADDSVEKSFDLSQPVLFGDTRIGENSADHSAEMTSFEKFTSTPEKGATVEGILEVSASLADTVDSNVNLGKFESSHFIVLAL